MMPICIRNKGLDADSDRDREWQKWPTTILAGAYLGFVAGKLIGRALKGYKIKMA